MSDPTRPIAPPTMPVEIPTDIEDRSDAPLRLLAMWTGGSLVRDLPSSGALIIGRGEGTHVLIDHVSVSRRHAAIVIGEVIRIEDLGSSNGTFVDGRRLAAGESVVLRPGALVEIGSVLLVLRTAAKPTSPTDRGPLVVCDPAMERVHELIDVVAKSDLSVLLLGETGVGKEVLASRVHAASRRSEKPLLKVNCAALVETLLEAELFGYERGAFTGAVQSKQGLLEEASGGTLFLDEIGEMPLSTQAKLLRVLESGEVTRVGGLKPRKVDVRFVAATNRDLKEQIASGRFRQDLYFRLEGLAIAVPALRDRPREIPALAARFVEQSCQGRTPVSLTQAAMDKLVSYPWPGNVRELRNVIARSVLLTTSPVVDANDLRFDAMGTGGSTPPPAMGGARPATLTPQPACGIPMEEQQRILRALEATAGNQTRAAKMLGISRSTLITRLDAMGVTRPRK